MKLLEEEGIRKKWSSDRKRILGNSDKWKATYEPITLQKLNSYASTGVVVSPSLPGSEPKVHPAFQVWESMLTTQLRMYGEMRLLEVEFSTLDRNVPPIWSSVHEAFSAAYMAGMMDIHMTYSFPIRFKGKVRPIGIDKKNLPYCALGMVIGEQEKALNLAKVLLAMEGYGYFHKRLGEAPFHLFLLGLLASHLEQPLPEMRGRAAGYPSYSALLEVWNDPDPSKLVAPCLKVCDIHTHLPYKQPDGAPPEFNDFCWSYLPIEILLLFKLRQLRGLENPVLDHPLMNTPRWTLPELQPAEPSELLRAVRTRAQEHGFDEAAIVQRIVSDEFGSLRPEGWRA